MMDTHRNRTVELFSSLLLRAAGRRCAALAAALAALMLALGAVPAVADSSPPSVEVHQHPCNAGPGMLIGIGPYDLFDNEGTNARWTDASFSNPEYLDPSSGIEPVHKARIFFQALTAAELNALSPPPPNPFYHSVTATMTNDEGHTATATRQCMTRYAPAPPAFTRTTPIDAPVGTLVVVYPDEVSDVASGRHFDSVTFSTTQYCSFCAPAGGGSADAIYVQAKTAGHTFTATVKVTNRRGRSSEGTVTFQTTQ